MNISLVLADVDGTLLTHEKVLTERARRAVAALRRARIRFAITSGRPPRGMAMLFEPLELDTPIAAFNGGIFVDGSLAILEQKLAPADVARKSIDLMHARGLDVWLYSACDWLITDTDAPHVAREIATVQFEPKVVDDFGAALNAVAKVVGVSDDHERVRRCEAEVQELLGDSATASRSQPYYLDITNREANKGAVVDYLAARLDISAAEIATIGDQQNDVLMFRRSGFSIAMGNASNEVKAHAVAVTNSCDEEGFAKAMERFVLGEAK